MTAASLLKALEGVGSVTKVFSYPYVKIFISSEHFAGLTDGAREISVADAISVSLDELRQTCSNALLMLRPVTPDELPIVTPSRSTHWLAGLTDSIPRQIPQAVTAVHFYGYKGGQARSTVLAEVAMSLAHDGWRVLVVDADIEAPSLDTLFAASSTSLGSTLLGIGQGGLLLQPLTVYVSDSGSRGLVDLINCWPKGASYSIDAAAFALRSALEPTVLERAVEKISAFARDQKYDVVFVDHRTGISPSTLPILNSLPGRAVVAVRLDEQWQSAKPFLQLVLRASFPDPGLFVVWKPDAEDTRSFNQRTYRQREDLLDMLADTFENSDSDEDSAVSASDIADHFIVWPYDSSFRSQRLPEPQSLDSANQNALARIRSLLRLGQKYPTTATERTQVDISGAKDQGDLIITRALRELLSPSNPYTFVLGRKGTGKTRLARELSVRMQGEPLLVSNDSGDPRGLRAGSSVLLDAIESAAEKPERFWLALFDAGVQSDNTQSAELSERFKNALDGTVTASEMVSSWQLRAKQRLFLLDSLETTFPSRYMASFLDALFRVLSMIEGESRIADQIRFRLFLRRDLAQPGFVQNIEQKLYGKSLELSWDYQSILNFMLSRIGQNTWYKQQFPDLAALLVASKERIHEGKISILECEEMLLLAFPTNMKRNNLSMTTFLRMYFADSASDRAPADSPNTDDIRRYYPRVFDDFLNDIPGPLVDQNGLPLPVLEEGRVSQQRMFRAHESAANNYLVGLKQELAYLINLSPDLGENQMQIDRLLNAFDGLRTPFKLDLRVGELTKATGVPSEAVRTALEKMKDVGMFEVRPDYPGEWRAGRLFKSSLRMKYGRGRAIQDLI